VKDQFMRTRILLGDEAFERLRAARVSIVGLGAVGSFATEALSRAGIGQLTLIDSDSIEETNINRQIFALHSTIGKDKCELAAARVRDINPDCEVIAKKAFIHGDSIDTVLENNPNIVVDAIDSLNPKVQLLAGLAKRKVPVIASMGAALRTDPTAIRTGDVFTTVGCPLARLIRKRLRRLGIQDGVDCVYSTEAHMKDKWRPSEKVNSDGKGRIRNILGSAPTIPGIFGLTIAQYVIDFLISD